MQQLPFLQHRILENPVSEYLICLGILLFGFLLKRLIALAISRQTFRFFKKFAQNQYSEEFVQLLRKPFEQLLTVFIIFYALNRLNFPSAWQVGPQEKFGLRWMIEALFEIAIIVVITRVLIRSTEFVSFVLCQPEDEKINKDVIRFSKDLIRVLFFIIAFFIILGEAFEVNITALIASLGIGGLAVALAAQDTIANLFGSFVIYLDKPFKVGDLVETGEVSGTIEKIGFRTTRVRTLNKSLLTVPNKKMVDAALNNITESTQRRVRFNIGLTYDSKSASLLKIIDDIKTAITINTDTADEITVRFTDFDSSSLNIMVIYFVETNDYDKMIEVKEAINIKIMEIVETHGCRFAYPTQTVYIEKGSD